METRKTDVAVIGAGTAGLGARREAERQGARTLLIESGPYGTTCARVGCMPSKLLIAAAEAAHEIAHADRFGLRVEGALHVDGRAVLERVRRERDRFVGFVVRDTEALADDVRLRGRARFVGPTALQVGDHTRVEARSVVIATGSSPFVPASLDPVRARVLLNDDIFELDDLPQSVAVVGGGVIALELGQALQRLGVRTRFFIRSGRLGPLTDPEIQSAAREILARELDLVFNASVEAAPSPSGNVQLRWRKADGATGEEEFERVLAASGRRPNLEGLGLEAAAVELDGRGIPVCDPRTGQLGDAPVFLAGDATGSLPILHEAADEGRIAGYNAARFPEVRAHRRRTPLAIVFSEPQIALVGQSYAELDLDRVAIGSVDYADQGRARVMGRNAGRVRLYASAADGRLIGAEMFGPRVEHTAHLLAWAIQEGLSVGRALELPFYHPVIEEGIRTALRDLAVRLRYDSSPCAHELDCGPGV